MELPVGLPQYLLPLAEIENENTMPQALAKEPEDFTLFFEMRMPGSHLGG